VNLRNDLPLESEFADRFSFDPARGLRNCFVPFWKMDNKNVLLSEFMQRSKRCGWAEETGRRAITFTNLILGRSELPPRTIAFSLGSWAGLWHDLTIFPPADENRDINIHHIEHEEIKRQRIQYNGDQHYPNVSFAFGSKEALSLTVEFCRFGHRSGV
jgi:hypothetical protein